MNSVIILTVLWFLFAGLVINLYRWCDDKFKPTVTAIIGSIILFLAGMCVERSRYTEDITATVPHSFATVSDQTVFLYETLNSEKKNVIVTTVVGLTKDFPAEKLAKVKLLKDTYINYYSGSMGENPRVAYCP